MTGCSKLVSRHRHQTTRRQFLCRALGGAVGAAAARRLVGQNPPLTVTRPPVRWESRLVAKIPEGYQVAVADVNGDGRPDILALSSGDNIVVWYQNPSWESHPITTATHANIALAPLFKAGYPAQGVALASDFDLRHTDLGGNIWWGMPGTSPNAQWTLSFISSIPTSHRLRWADLDGRGQLELVDAPLVGAGATPPDYDIGAPITWFRMPGGFLTPHASSQEERNAVWFPHLIDDALTVVHGLLPMDWNGDGRDELLTASFEGVSLLESTGDLPNLDWSRVHLASGDQTTGPRRGASEIGVGTVAGRRFFATIEPWHGNQVVVYTMPPGDSSGVIWDRHVIDDSFRSGHALVCGDLDQDGNDEIVAGYRGPGTSLYLFRAVDSSALRWERQLLDNEMGASCAVLADLNGDGRLDIVAIGSSTGNVKWYENLG